jgi:uncharacterized protein
MAKRSRNVATGKLGVRVLPLCLLAAIVAGCAHDPTVAIDAPNGARRAAVRVELALTPAKRELGLMYRNHLDKDSGMLFVFRVSERLHFWMKNTEIPLDMIFANSSHKIVGIVANAEPYSLRSVGPDANAQYVLEVNGGFCARHGIRIGDRMRLVGIKPYTLE